ncbi:hypothetical protein NSPZN2_20049 [Nitrospira defluvii]|uniref:Uncharacterized protein n=1 Tax=Nitrospira defluvii TaxID=330214 RepID=A0ABM8RDC8_9BACT|nr:hypothetical protein NSPZN2_20049 [Nitrospira defluvii]
MFNFINIRTDFQLTAREAPITHHTINGAKR